MVIFADTSPRAEKILEAQRNHLIKASPAAEKTMGTITDPLTGITIPAAPYKYRSPKTHSSTRALTFLNNKKNQAIKIGSKVKSAASYVNNNKVTILKSALTNLNENKEAIAAGMVTNIGVKLVVTKVITGAFGATAFALTTPALLATGTAVTAAVLGGGFASFIRTAVNRKKQAKINDEVMQRNYRLQKEGRFSEVANDLPHDMHKPWVWDAFKKGMFFGALGATFAEAGTHVISANMDAISSGANKVVNVVGSNAHRAILAGSETVSEAWHSAAESITPKASAALGGIKSFVGLCVSSAQEANQGLIGMDNIQEKATGALALVKETSWWQSTAAFFAPSAPSLDEANEVITNAVKAAVEDNSAQYGKIDPALAAQLAGARTPEEMISDLVSEQNNTLVDHDAQYETMPTAEDLEVTEIILPEVPEQLAEHFPNLDKENFAFIPENVQEAALRAAKSGNLERIIKSGKEMSFYLMNRSGDESAQEAGAKMVYNIFNKALNNELLVSTDVGRKIASDMAWLDYSGAYGNEQSLHEAATNALLAGENKQALDILKNIESQKPGLVSKVKELLFEENLYEDIKDRSTETFKIKKTVNLASNFNFG